ncbi:MAG: type II secretory pathway predicted ATPase ExeA/cytoskeletal protein CcmA (bactofilin family) [Desulforhopalus sp.]|jgi:type II secretory pathway predicted ATPase ExeA/cytoskeletal protein CcmA (bactofilin family)
MKENCSKIDGSMKVKGHIVTGGDLVLEGEIHGSFVGQDLTIAASGRIVGEVEGAAIHCAGHLEGRVEAKSLKVVKGGRQVGVVVTEELEVESGAIIDCVLHSSSTGKTFIQPDKTPEKKINRVDLNTYLNAFKEDERPCCFEVPWSKRWELYDHILDLLKKKKQLIKIVGESGSGKTALVNKLLKDSIDKHELLHLQEKVGSVTTLIKEVAVCLGLSGCAKYTGQVQLLVEIRLELAKRNKAGQRVVLLVDDAQEMFQATMEGVIRLLSGAYGEEEVDPDECLSIILFGTGEMKSNMVATILEYFEDETNCQLTLDPLTMKDTADYLRLGLQVASSGDEATAMALLPNETIKEIHVHSKGSIAAINIMMDDALQKANEMGGNSLLPK